MGGAALCQKRHKFHSSDPKSKKRELVCMIVSLFVSTNTRFVWRYYYKVTSTDSINRNLQWDSGCVHWGPTCLQFQNLSLPLQRICVNWIQFKIHQFFMLHVWTVATLLVRSTENLVQFLSCSFRSVYRFDRSYVVDIILFIRLLDAFPTTKAKP